MGLLDGNVILIVHATEFVGGAVTDACLREGATVIAQDEKFHDFAEREAFEGAHAGAIGVGTEDPDDLIREVLSGQGRLDGLVANDGFPAIRAKVEDADPQDMRNGLEAMVVEPFRLIGAAVRHMKQTGYGRIVVASSAVPFRGLSNYGMYVTARGAQNAMVLSLGRELAKTGITVNAVGPNFAKNPTYFPDELLANEDMRAKIESQIPMGRFGEPEEVSSVFTYLLSRNAGFVTGHCVPVAGGWA
ncbi:MAG: SDR family oxidoreductase [Alphaproteobacteria bacterium]